MKIAAYVIEGNGTFAEDVPAFAELIKGSDAEVVLVPGTSRVKRAMPAAARSTSSRATARSARSSSRATRSFRVSCPCAARS